jgi:protein-arginine kinase activator protein McsA|tara:strand:+ start:250 stop:459 length:210 start_codon:yes stop_codon:yes gene_type:complete
MSEEVETVNPVEIPELDNVTTEKAISQKIIKFCCNCGIEFSQFGETGKYFGCKNCGIIVKVNVLDSNKL